MKTSNTFQELCEELVQLMGERAEWMPLPAGWTELYRRICAAVDEEQAKQAAFNIKELELPTEILNPLLRAGLRRIDEVEQLGMEGLIRVKTVGPLRASLILKAVAQHKRCSKTQVSQK